MIDINSRVRVDWNNDRHIHKPLNNGIVKNNLIKDSLYPYSINCISPDKDDTDYSENINNPGDYSILYRKSILGRNAGNYGQGGLLYHTPKQWNRKNPENIIDGLDLPGITATDATIVQDIGFKKIVSPADTSSVQKQMTVYGFPVESGKKYVLRFKYTGLAKAVLVYNSNDNSLLTNVSLRDINNDLIKSIDGRLIEITWDSIHTGTVHLLFTYQTATGYPDYDKNIPLIVSHFMLHKTDTDLNYRKNDLLMYDYYNWGYNYNKIYSKWVKGESLEHRASPIVITDLEKITPYSTTVRRIDNIVDLNIPENNYDFQRLVIHKYLKPDTSYTITCIYKPDNYAKANINVSIFGEQLPSYPVITSLDGGYIKYTVTFTTRLFKLINDNSEIQINFTTSDPINQSLEIAQLNITENRIFKEKYYQSGIPWDKSQFSIYCEKEKSYILSFFANSTDADTLKLQLHRCALGLTDVTTLNYEFNIEPKLNKYEIEIDSSLIDTGVYFTYDLYKNNNLHGYDNRLSVDFQGFMLVEGNTPAVYTTDLTGQYDDITEYVLSVDWKSGVSDVDSLLSYEGTANFVLNNSTRYFSIENTESPLYGLLTLNKKIIIEIQNPETFEWYTIWAGWITDYKTEPGLNSTKQTTIQAKQGMYRLRDSTLAKLYFKNTNVTNAVTKLIEYSGWLSLNDPLQTVLGYPGSLLGINTHLINIKDLFSDYNNTYAVYDNMGEFWNNTTSLETALKQVLSTENTRLWLTRDGHLRLLDRTHFIYRESEFKFFDVEKSLSATYIYGDKIVNRVSINVKEKEEQKDVIVWQSGTPIKVEPNSKKVVNIQSYFEEGSPKTITKINSDMDVSVYYAKNRETVKKELKDIKKVFIDIVEDSKNQQYIYIHNNSNTTYFFDIKLYGNYLPGSDGVTYVFDNYESQELTGNIQSKNIDTHILQTEQDCKALSDYYFLNYALPYGHITKFTLNNNTLENAYNIINFQNGTKLNLSDTQTGMKNVPHYIIGTSGKIRNKSITVDYQLSAIPKTTYTKVGDKIAYNYRDMLQVTPLHRLQMKREDNTFYFDKTLDTFYFGTAGDELLTYNNFVKSNTKYIETDTGIISTGCDISLKGISTDVIMKNFIIPPLDYKLYFQYRFINPKEDDYFVLNIKGLHKNGQIIDIVNKKYVYDGQNDGTTLTGDVHTVPTLSHYNTSSLINSTDIIRIQIRFLYNNSNFEIQNVSLERLFSSGIISFNNRLHTIKLEYENTIPGQLYNVGFSGGFTQNFTTQAGVNTITHSAYPSGNGAVILRKLDTGASNITLKTLLLYDNNYGTIELNRLYI